MSSQSCHFSEFLTQRVCCLCMVWKFCPAKQLHHGEAMLVYSSDPWTFWGGRTCVLEVAFSHSCPLLLVVTSVLFLIRGVKQNRFLSVPGHAASLPCPQMLTKLANIAEPGLLWVSQGMVFHLLGGTAGSGALLHVPTSNILSLGLGPWASASFPASSGNTRWSIHRKYKVGYSLF